MKWFVYIIKGINGHFYTGVTTDVKRRVNQHNGMVEGGARATRMFRPYTLVFQEGFSSRSEVQKRESAIKQLTHAEKAILVTGGKKANIRRMSAS